MTKNSINQQSKRKSKTAPKKPYDGFPLELLSIVVF